MTRLVKSIFILALTVSVAAGSTDICAQTSGRQTEKKNPIEIIEEESEGRIKINMPDDILELILSAPAPKKPRPQSHKATGKMQGYRIQVFSDGRNQASLEARAKARGNAIASRFPKYRGQVYVFSKSPNWYARIGNFRTLGEANAALAELRRAFPAFSSEMRAVKCQIYAR